MTRTLTTAQARKLGYHITAGAYVGTSDDCAGRWYVQLVDAEFVDRRGPGYRTRREALNAIAIRLDDDYDNRATLEAYCGLTGDAK